MKKQNRNILIWTSLGILVLLFGSGLFAITGLNYLQIYNKETGLLPQVTETLNFGDYNLVLITNSFTPTTSNSPIKISGNSDGEISVSNSYSSIGTSVTFTALASSNKGKYVNNNYVIGRIENFKGNLTGTYTLYQSGANSMESFGYINIYVNDVLKYTDYNQFIGGSGAPFNQNQKNGNIKLSVNEPSTVEVVVLASPGGRSSSSSSATLNIPAKVITPVPTPNPDPTPTPSPNPNPTPSPSPTPSTTTFNLEAIATIIAGIGLLIVAILYIKNRRK